jgi:hypothetical protein
MAHFSFVKAMASHRPLHEALMRDFPSDDDIVRRSTMLMADLCRNLGQNDDAEKFSRQALQMCLNTFGPRHRETLRASKKGSFWSKRTPLTNCHTAAS